MALGKLVKLDIFLWVMHMSSITYHFDRKRGRISEGERGVEVESVDWWIQELQACDIECAL
jgi:hypothetical protein